MAKVCSVAGTPNSFIPMGSDEIMDTKAVKTPIMTIFCIFFLLFDMMRSFCKPKTKYRLTIEIINIFKSLSMLFFLYNPNILG